MRLVILTIIFILSQNISTNAQSSEIKIRPRIKNIVERLKKEDLVYFGYRVGYGAVPETNNRYYKLYLKLKKKATNEELAVLTKDTMKIIDIYAYSILHSRNYENLKEIFLEHRNDSAYFWTAGSCTGFIDRVNWYMLRKLNPSNQNNNRIYLTQEEFEKYCIEFKKEDINFY